ncbi:unnamed protein product [Knipowitschia caucasica]
MQMSNNSSLLQCNNIGSYVAFTSWIAVYLHIFPTFISVTFFAFRKWKWHRSTITHSDVFTFHMVVMELLNLVGSGLSFVRLMWRPNLSESGIGLKYFASIGVMWLHILTCVERYMAVVHPITYLRLKKRGGVTIRNISLGWAWVFSGAFVILEKNLSNYTSSGQIIGLGIAVVCAFILLFFSVTVLCVLIRPKPGEVVGGNRRVDQSKRATMYTMIYILGALMLRMAAVVVFYTSHFDHDIELCFAIVFMYWLAIPSSLVLPLLFLHREGIL